MRLIYFGTGSFAIPTLRDLAPHVVLVVTQPDRPSGRGMRLAPSPVKLVAQELGLSVETPEKSRSPEFVAQLQSVEADALLVASYGQILSQAVLDSTKRGGINLHGSVLPKYRGAAPIQRAILAGELESGVSLMQMDKGMDTGDVIEIARTRVDPDETYGQLQDRLAEIAADLAVAWMPKIVAGEYERTPQDSSRATIAPKVDREEAALEVSRPTEAEYNRFRAFTPAPGAFVRSRFGHLKILSARLAGGAGSPGEVLGIRDGVIVAFEGGAIELVELQPEGKKRMTGRDFANGARLRPGERFI